MITLVANNVYRGPEPKTNEDILWIQKNIKTVIRLENDLKETDELAPATVIPRLISNWQIYLTGIKQDYLNSILKLIFDSPKPLLVHCLHGQDRTGLIVAGYRVRQQGWTKDEAFDEAKRFGYRWYLNFGLNQTWEKFQSIPPFEKLEE